MERALTAAMRAGGTAVATALERSPRAGGARAVGADDINELPDAIDSDLERSPTPAWSASRDDGALPRSLVALVALAGSPASRRAARWRRELLAAAAVMAAVAAAAPARSSS